MSISTIWKTEDASFLRDRRSIYSREVIFYDLAVAVVEQPDLDRLWIDNAATDVIPKLPNGKRQGILIFYEGGELEIKNIQVSGEEIRSISLHRVFPQGRRSMQAALYVTGIVDISGQLSFPFCS